MSVHAHVNSIPDLVLMRKSLASPDGGEEAVQKASDLNFTFSPLLQFGEREAFWPCGMDCRWRCGLFHRSWVCWASFSLSGAGENPRKRDWRITLQLKSYEKSWPLILMEHMLELFPEFRSHWTGKIALKIWVKVHPNFSCSMAFFHVVLLPVPYPRDSQCHSSL